eukprot:3480218-Rhodomonas_salina.1
MASPLWFLFLACTLYNIAVPASSQLCSSNSTANCTESLWTNSTRFNTTNSSLFLSPSLSNSTINNTNASSTYVNTTSALGTCSDGFILTSSQPYDCVDADECETLSHNCDSNAACSNSNGSFSCTCNLWAYTGNGTVCELTGACELGVDTCHQYASCTSTSSGTFVCACNSGFGGDGTTCVEQDECSLNTHNCDTNAECTNSLGSFTCECNQWVYTGNGTSCTLTGPCELGTDTCDASASCESTEFGFDCECNTGYDGTGISCEDEDECSTGSHNCDANAACANTDGSFQVHSQRRNVLATTGSKALEWLATQLGHVRLEQATAASGLCALPAQRSEAPLSHARDLPVLVLYITKLCVVRMGRQTAYTCSCPSGWASNRASERTCTYCPPDTYKPAWGTGECLDCPRRSTSTGGSSSCMCDPGAALLWPLSTISLSNALWLQTLGLILEAAEP